MFAKIEKYNLTNWAMVVIAILHLVGSVGLLSAYSSSFAALTALNLFICFLLILPFSVTSMKHVMVFFSLAFSFGMLLEIIGVNTGCPFGTY